MEHILESSEQLEIINADYFKYFPEEIGIKFSGCNYYINRGNVWTEPIGTATSMHDCNGCDEYESCKDKKDNPVWRYE